MIKKVVLLISTLFLILFSSNSFADNCPITYRYDSNVVNISTELHVNGRHLQYLTYWIREPSQFNPNPSPDPRPSTCNIDLTNYSNPDFIIQNPLSILSKTDEECHAEFSGDSIPLSLSSAQHLQSGGSVTAGFGACSVSAAGGVDVCLFDSDSGELKCSVNLQATSTGDNPDITFGKDIDLLQSDFSESGKSNFSPVDYLDELPGACTAVNCVTIGDKSYLVDWEKAPDWFEYFDNNGNVQRKPSTTPTDPGGDTGGGSDGGDVPGGCFGNCYPGGGSGDNDGDNDSGGGSSGGGSGNNTGGGNTGGGSSGGGSGGGSSGGGGSTGGGSTGGGSTVPDFEFDDSGVIEAIRSSGQSNRNAIDALSNDVTGTISSENSRLITETDRQTGRVTTAITSQTQSIQNTLDNQTRSLNSTLEGMQKALTDAFGNIKVQFTGGSGSGDGSSESEGEGEEGDGLGGLLDTLVDKLASAFTEETGDGDNLFNTAGVDATLGEAVQQEQQYGDDVNSLMDEIGNGSSSGIADQVTSRLPSLPSGNCTPLKFGMMEISCQAHNTIKLWLSWIIYFWTVVSIVDTFFRSGQRTA